MGTREQARDYCKKEETRVPDTQPIEYGTWISGAGSRTDILKVKDMLDRGESFSDISDQYFGLFVRYSRGFRAYRELRIEPRHEKSEVYVLYGDPGTGKSQEALKKAGPQAYWKPTGNWWDGYEGQEDVVLDDYHGGNLPFSTLVRLLDCYPLTLETKGGHVVFKAKRIWITSNAHPEDWYNQAKCPSSAIMRRITKLVRHRVDLPPEVEFDRTETGTMSNNNNI